MIILFTNKRSEKLTKKSIRDYLSIIFLLWIGIIDTKDTKYSKLKVF